MKFLLEYNTVILWSKYGGYNLRVTPRVATLARERLKKKELEEAAARIKNPSVKSFTDGGDSVRLTGSVSELAVKVDDEYAKTVLAGIKNRLEPAPIKVTWGGQNLKAKSFEFEWVDNETEKALGLMQILEAKPFTGCTSPVLHAYEKRFQEAIVRDIFMVRDEVQQYSTTPINRVMISKSLKERISGTAIMKAIEDANMKVQTPAEADFVLGQFVKKPVTHESNWPGKGKSPFGRKR